MPNPQTDPVKHHPSYIVRIFNLLTTKFRNWSPSVCQGYLNTIRNRVSGWTANGRVKTSPVVGQEGIEAGAGIVTDKTTRVTNATDDTLLNYIAARIIDYDLPLDDCNTPAGWILALGAANLNTHLSHVIGNRSVVFNKVAGNATAYIHKVLGSPVDASEFKGHDLVAWCLYLSSIANVDSIFLRLGTDTANYSQWDVQDDDLLADTWMSISAAISGVRPAVVGNGVDLTDVRWMAVGVVFDAAGDTLNSIRVDHLKFQSSAHTNAQLNAELNTEIASADINLHRVGNIDTDVDHGVSAAGTQRVAANIIDNQNGVDGDHGVCTVASPRVAANIINNQNGVTADIGNSDVSTQRVAVISDQPRILTTGGIGQATITHGQETVAIPGTEERLNGAASYALADGQAVAVKALHTNTREIAVGDTGVTLANGFILFPGEVVSLKVADVNDIWIDVVIGAEGASWIVEG